MLMRRNPQTREASADAGSEGDLACENTHISSLRRYYPDQVRRVGAALAPSQPPQALGAPLLLLLFSLQQAFAFVYYLRVCHNRVSTTELSLANEPGMGG